MINQEKNVVMNFFEQIGLAFNHSVDLNELLKIILICSSRTTQAKGEAIFLFDDEEPILKAKIVEGVFPPLKDHHHLSKSSKLVSKAKYLNENLFNTSFQLGEGVIGEVALNKESILISNAETDERIIQPEVDYLKIKTLMASPLTFQDEILGVMIAINKTNESAFTENDLHLFESLAGQAAISIYNAKMFSQMAEKQKLDRDLEIAKEIQNLLLPKEKPRLEGIDISGYSDPASKVGGDYYDFIPLSTHQTGIAIADVSGKGIPASLIMSMARSILRSLALKKLSPASVLKQLNSLIHPDIRVGMFISMSYLVIDQIQKELTISRAGHEPLIYFNHKDSQIQSIQGKGMVLGLNDGQIFNQQLDELTIRYNPNDIFILYTDGITEATNMKGEQFGIHRLHEIIRNSHHMNSTEIIQQVCSRVKRFIGEAPQSDDITLVVIKINR